MKGFAFRHQYSVAHVAKAYTAIVTVGDAAAMPAGLQTTFASNWKNGGQKTVVFTGTINFPALSTYPTPPAPADSPVPFTTPHVYPGADPLLWEVNVSGTTPVLPTQFYERGPGSTHTAGRIGNGCVPAGGTLAMSSTGSVASAVPSAMIDQLNNGPATAPAILMIGDTGATFSSLPLPIDLVIIASPGCFLHINVLATVPFTTSATGVVVSTLYYTMSPSLSGQRLRTQWAAVDSIAKVCTSNGLDQSVPYSATTGIAWPQNRVYANGFGSTPPATGTLQGNGLVTEWWY